MVAALFYSPSTFPSAVSSLRSPNSTTLSSTLLRLHHRTQLSFCPKTHHPTNTSFLCLSHWSEAEAPFPTSDFPPLYPEEDDKWDSSKYEALLKGGEQVTSVLQDMVNLVIRSSLSSYSSSLTNIFNFLFISFFDGSWRSWRTWSWTRSRRGWRSR